MSTISFRAAIKIRGINPFVTVSATQAAKLKTGWHKPLPVLIRFKGRPEKTFRTNLMPAGDGSFYLYLNGEMRKAARAGVGDRVEGEIDFDSAYRNGPLHPMPAAFKKAIKANPEAARNWAVLAPSRRKEVLRYLAHLKSPEARERNIERAFHVLSGKTGRFMARTWTNGS